MENDEKKHVTKGAVIAVIFVGVISYAMTRFYTWDDQIGYMLGLCRWVALMLIGHFVGVASWGQHYELRRR